MFVPVHDSNSLKTIPFQFVTVGLIAINVIVFGFTSLGGNALAAASFAIVPGEILPELTGQTLGTPDRFDTIPVPEPLTLITYMFLHGDILHLAGNMLFLWVFGDNVEDALGHVSFLIFYLLCGAAAGLLHVYMLPTSGVPLIGASGAVAGCVAAYLMLHPKVDLWVLVFRVFPLQIRAYWALGAWIIMQFVLAYATLLEPTMGRTTTAWWAHVGGLIAGAVLVVFMRRRGVPLFDQADRMV